VKRKDSLIFMAILLLGFGQLSAQELIFNTQDFAPFTYMNGDVVAGPAVDIIKAVCKEAGIAYSIRLLPWTRAQDEVKKGTSHALFLIGWNKERAETFYFSPPILNTEYGIFVNADSTLKYTTPVQLRGYTIGVYGPSNTSTSLDELKKKRPDIVVDMTPDDVAAFKKLELKRVSAVYSNRDVGAALISRLKLVNVRYAGTDKPLKYYIGFSKEFVDKAVFDRFVQAYKDLYAEGAIKKILDSYGLTIAALE